MDKKSDTIRRSLHEGFKTVFVMANGSMSSNQSGEGVIRKAINNTDLMDFVGDAAPQPLHTTRIPKAFTFQRAA